MTRKYPTEQQECFALMQWANLYRIDSGKIADYLIHIPNEGRRSAFTGHNLKRMGMMPGVSDYMLCVPSKSFNGMFLEMKRISEKGKKKRENQDAFMDRMRKTGYYCTYSYGFENARDLILKYLEKKC